MDRYKEATFQAEYAEVRKRAVRASSQEIWQGLSMLTNQMTSVGELAVYQVEQLAC